MTVAVREGAPTNCVPVMVTVNDPFGKVHESIELAEGLLPDSVTELGCRLQRYEGRSKERYIVPAKPFWPEVVTVDVAV